MLKKKTLQKRGSKNSEEGISIKVHHPSRERGQGGKKKKLESFSSHQLGGWGGGVQGIGRTILTMIFKEKKAKERKKRKKGVV